jgi:hypothetical protein
VKIHIYASDYPDKWNSYNPAQEPVGKVFGDWRVLVGESNRRRTAVR